MSIDKNRLLGAFLGAAIGDSPQSKAVAGALGFAVGDKLNLLAANESVSVDDINRVVNDVNSAISDMANGVTTYVSEYSEITDGEIAKISLHQNRTAEDISHELDQMWAVFTNLTSQLNNVPASDMLNESLNDIIDRLNNIQSRVDALEVDTGVGQGTSDVIEVVEEEVLEISAPAELFLPQVHSVYGPYCFSISGDPGWNADDFPGLTRFWTKQDILTYNHNRFDFYPNPIEEGWDRDNTNTLTMRDDIMIVVSKTTDYVHPNTQKHIVCYSSTCFYVIEPASWSDANLTYKAPKRIINFRNLPIMYKRGIPIRWDVDNEVRDVIKKYIETGILDFDTPAPILNNNSRFMDIVTHPRVNRGGCIERNVTDNVLSMSFQDNHLGTPWFNGGTSFEYTGNARMHPEGARAFYNDVPIPWERLQSHDPNGSEWI